MRIGIFTLDELEALVPGGPIGITEDQAKHIQYRVHEIAGHLNTGDYDGKGGYYHLYKTVDAIAKVTVAADTDPSFLDIGIPKLVECFRALNLWRITADECQAAIRQRIRIWHGRLGKLKLAAERRPSHKQRALKRTISEQLEAYRLEADLTQEVLAELVNLPPRTVQRHLSGETQKPSPRFIRRYEKVFSEHLETTVVIEKVS